MENNQNSGQPMKKGLASGKRAVGKHVSLKKKNIASGQPPMPDESAVHQQFSSPDGSSAYQQYPAPDRSAIPYQSPIPDKSPAPEYHVNFEKRSYFQEETGAPVMEQDPFPDIRVADDYQPNFQEVQQSYQQDFQQSYQQSFQEVQQPHYHTKYCKFCASKIPFDAVVCTHCGRQVEVLQQAQPNVQQVIQPQTIVYQQEQQVRLVPRGRAKNKWIAFVLCLFFGWAGAHKFYEGKNGLGIAYLCTGGFFGVGWIIDLLKIFFRPDETYYVD